MSILLFIEPIIRPESSFFWMPYFVLMSLILVAYVNQKNNAIKIAINSFFDLRFFRQSIREETNTSLQYSKVLLLNSFLILAIVINYFIGDLVVQNITSNKYSAFFILLAFVSLWFIFNIGIKKIVAAISNTQKTEVEDRRYNQYFFQTLGLFLLPGVVGLYFFPVNLFGFNVIILVEIYIKIVVIITLLNKLIQSIFQSFEIKISWGYIFLYICTLEILPLCIGFQLLVA